MRHKKKIEVNLFTGYIREFQERYRRERRMGIKDRGEVTITEASNNVIVID